MFGETADRRRARVDSGIFQRRLARAGQSAKTFGRIAGPDRRRIANQSNAHPENTERLCEKMPGWKINNRRLQQTERFRH